eukprot:m.428240 g.428240  ORF g.428240 m.428240 type:complete len:65 (+) comp67937_c0_seq1:116-310(+)
MIQSATQPPRYDATHADANAPRVHDWTKMRRKKKKKEKERWWRNGAIDIYAHESGQQGGWVSVQ